MKYYLLLFFESGNHMRAAIFSVHPVNARLSFNGQTVTTDKEGMVIIEKPIGEYNYQVEAPGYLVKVALKEVGAEFEGNVMGDVEFTGKEYLVYLPNGTKRSDKNSGKSLPKDEIFSLIDFDI